MKFYCLGLNSKLFKKKKKERKVNNRKGMFHCLKVTFTKCVSSELFSFSWEAWRRPCKRHRNYTQPSFCINIPNCLYPLVACLLHVLHQAHLAPGASRSRTNHYVPPSSLPISYGSHTGIEVGAGGTGRQVRNDSFVSPAS